MKVDIWMPIYINDYLADTMRLDAEKHGIYFLLMMDYWKHKQLPTDTTELSMIARVPEGSKSLIYILDNFFQLNGDKYKHKRIEKELELANSRRESARQNGKKGGRPKKNPQKTHGLSGGKPTKNPKGNPDHNPQKTSSPSPSTILPKGNNSTESFPLNAEDSLAKMDEINNKIIELQDNDAEQSEIDNLIKELHDLEDSIYAV